MVSVMPTSAGGSVTCSDFNVTWLDSVCDWLVIFGDEVIAVDVKCSTKSSLLGLSVAVMILNHLFLNIIHNTVSL